MGQRVTLADLAREAGAAERMRRSRERRAPTPVADAPRPQAETTPPVTPAPDGAGLVEVARAINGAVELVRTALPHLPTIITTLRRGQMPTQHTAPGAPSARTAPAATPPAPASDAPPVHVALDVDRLYAALLEAGRLVQALYGDVPLGRLLELAQANEQAVKRELLQRVGGYIHVQQAPQAVDGAAAR